MYAIIFPIFRVSLCGCFVLNKCVGQGLSIVSRWLYLNTSNIGIELKKKKKCNVILYKCEDCKDLIGI